MNDKILYIDFDLPYLFTDKIYPVGGTAVEWSNWISGILSSNVDVELLSFKGANKVIKDEINFKIIESYNQNAGIPKLRWLYYRIPKLFFSIRKSKAKYIIQQNASLLSGVLAFICMLQRKKFIYRVGSDIDSTYKVKNKLSGLSYYSYIYSLHKANLLICQNEFQKENLSKRFPNKKIIKLYNPYNFNKITNSYDEERNRSGIAWIGNFREVKGLPYLFEIAKENPNIEFNIAGTFSDDTNDIKNIVNQLDSLKNVNIKGYLNPSEVNSLLRNSICLLNTSKYEGLSNTYIEAMFAGTPIITTKNADPDNMIKENNLGFVAEDYSQITNLILKLSSNFDYDNFYKKSNNYAIKNFNHIDQGKKLIEGLNGI
tara:strand:+ start:16212 stop:17327 length:1116 start_codon:yes stop_codon:yes gene_type:complete